jgi:ketosteroid isomerase-like protein
LRPSPRPRDTARAMSQENVEVCRRVFEALGMHRDTDAAFPYLDPEIELRSAIVGGAEGNTYRGHEGIRRWMAESDATWVELRLETKELRDLGDDVLLIGRLHARGRGSGIEIDSPIAWLSTVRSGRIVCSRGFLDPQEALEAAGLQE